MTRKSKMAKEEDANLPQINLQSEAQLSREMAGLDTVHIMNRVSGKYFSYMPNISV